MIGLDALLAQFPEIEAVEITSWVERGWVCPDRDGGRLAFEEIDIARVRLIRDLRRDMALGEEAIPVVLGLMDQVYELRGQLRTVLRALQGQPAEVRRSVLSALGLSGV